MTRRSGTIVPSVSDLEYIYVDSGLGGVTVFPLLYTFSKFFIRLELKMDELKLEADVPPPKYESQVVDTGPAEGPVEPDKTSMHDLRNALLQPVMHLPLTTVGFAITNYIIQGPAWREMADGLHFVAFYCVAAVASVVVNVPLFLHLGKESVKAAYDFDDVGPLDLLDSPCESQAECQEPRRITPTSEIRTIVLLGIVAGLWLLVVVVYITLDAPSFVVEVLESGRSDAPLSLPEWIINRLQVGVALGSHLILVLSLCFAFLVQLSIWILCLSERYQFILFINTKLAPADEENGNALISL